MQPITLVSYLLEKDPVRFTILREGESLLSVSTSYDFENMDVLKNGIRLQTSGGELSLVQDGSKLSFCWQGGQIETRIRLEGRWFGIGELVHQAWDLSKVTLPLSDFLVADAGASGYSNLMSPVFFQQAGVLLIVRSPFKLGINQLPGPPPDLPEFVLGDEISFDQRPAFDTKGQGDGYMTLVGDDLGFDLLIAEDLVAAHRLLIEQVGHPKTPPPLEFFGKPVWTTWAQFKEHIHQEKVLDYARQIRDNGFPYSVLEIDDRWQAQYGDLVFDPKRFPDPKAMIDELHAMGFKVTAWVIPFMHPKSEAAQIAGRHGYLVKQTDGSPYLLRWWQGMGYLLDATNPQAMEWFGRRLRSLQQETGLDGFKFDGGEAMFVPPDAVLHKPGDSRNHYSHAYVDWVGRNFSLCEVRTGWNNQTSPLLFRLWDLFSTWGRDNGLQSVIPATLALSLTGYPFTFPDMIGGNGYFMFPKNKLLRALINKVIIPLMERNKQNNSGDEYAGVHASDVPEFIQTKAMFGWPTAELMIRWTQLNALLPVMQFSITPWQFGEECTDICRKYTELHLEFTPLFEMLAERSTRTGEPIVRPVFWLAPDDPNALDCQDQFLIGSDLLVAPVVVEGARSRDIYLPPGVWQDHWSGVQFNGPQVLKEYPAPLDQLPFFHRTSK